VGQPRDETYHAKYVIYDTDYDTIKIRFIDYDVNEAVALIRKANYPEMNAKRLTDF